MFLIGFDNGVYDLKMHMFRDGMPDDYIYLSTKQNYVSLKSHGSILIGYFQFRSKLDVAKICILSPCYEG